MKINILILFLILLLSCKKDEPFMDYRQDVNSSKILDDTFVVGGRLTINSNNSRILRTITLPPKTKYWVFWFGVSQEAKQKYLQTVNNIPEKARAITTEPVIALGLNIIQSIILSANSGSDNIDSYFASSASNAQNFLNGNNWSYYPFFNGEQMVNTYRVVRIEDTPLDNNRRLYMTFQNYKDFRDMDVQLKIWAFTEK